MIDILFYLGGLLPMGLLTFFVSVILYPCHDPENKYDKGVIIAGVGVAMIVIGSFAIIIGWLSQ